MIFEAVDTNCDGVLDKQEIRAAVHKVFRAAMTRAFDGLEMQVPRELQLTHMDMENFVDEIVGSTDGNADAKVSFEELIGILAQKGVTQDSMAAVLADFDETKDSLREMLVSDEIVQSVIAGLRL